MIDLHATFFVFFEEWTLVISVLIAIPMSPTPEAKPRREIVAPPWLKSQLRRRWVEGFEAADGPTDLDLEKVGPWARNECFECQKLPVLATGNLVVGLGKVHFVWKEATVSSQLVVKDVQEHQQQKRRFKKVDFLLIWPNSTVET